MRMLGAPPTSYKPDGRPLYTLPVIVDPLRNRSAPAVLSNVGAIADYLEAAYPARPIFPDGARALQTLFAHYVQDVFAKPLLPILVPLTHQCLPERAQVHVRPASRGPSGVGMGPASGAALTSTQREQAWAAVREQFNFLASILDKNTLGGDGVVAMGRDVTYADFALCSVL